MTLQEISSLGRWLSKQFDSRSGCFASKPGLPLALLNVHACGTTYRAARPFSTAFCITRKRYRPAAAATGWRCAKNRQRRPKRLPGCRSISDRKGYHFTQHHPQLAGWYLLKRP